MYLNLLWFAPPPGDPKIRNPETGNGKAKPRIQNPESGIRNQKFKNKAEQSSSNTQKLSFTFLACKSKEVNKNGFKAQLLKKGYPVFQFNVRATVIVIPCVGCGYTNLEYRTV